MTEAISNRDICFNKAVLLLCEHGHFSLNFAYLAPNTIRVIYLRFIQPIKGIPLCSEENYKHGGCCLNLVYPHHKHIVLLTLPILDGNSEHVAHA